MRHLIFIACLAASTASAQQVLYSVNGPGDTRFGSACAPIGDQNADGYIDLLVGAPDQDFVSKANVGAIYVVSGKYLATGIGPSTFFWIDVGWANADSQFGTAIAMPGDLVGDSAPDWVVSMPNYKFNGTITTGALCLIDGSTRAVVSVLHGTNDTRLGRAVVAVGDQNGDGLGDLVATQSSTNETTLKYCFVSGSTLVQGGTLLTTVWNSFVQQTGVNLSAFDFDGDGALDVAIGAPLDNQVLIYRADGTFDFLGWYWAGNTSEHAGASISAGEDYDGDGVIDLLVGAPNWNNQGAEAGRVIVVSGASVLAPANSPVVIASLTIPFGGVTATAMHFGAAVCAGPDLNGDGIGEILAGAPEFSTFGLSGGLRGSVSVFSGATLMRMGSIAGAQQEHLGDMLVPGFQDLNGDGFLDFAVAGTSADNPTANCGVLKSVSLFPSYGTSYCTAKTNSLGCVPQMTANGNASVSSGTPFLVGCSNVINQKSGLLFYAFGPAAVPFQDGYLCTQLPTQRTSAQNSQGSASGSDCTGTFSFDFNARIQSGVDPMLIVGRDVFCQHWSRDPQSASTTNLSNALRFLINP